tara:strand:+ start:482 stop:1162 length:681 start_codon:yes stop_codon:yes gene_type:complete
MDRLGCTGLADYELLALLFCAGGRPGSGLLDLSLRLLLDAGPAGLAALAQKDLNQLQRVTGLGPSRSRQLLALLEFSRRVFERPLLRGDLCDSPGAVYASLRGRLWGRLEERFIVLSLDSKLRKLAETEVCRGGANAVFVDPRQVFGAALRQGASALVLVHNHPSGDPRPSGSDLALTERLVVVGELLGVAVVDHIVMGDGCYYSLSEAGEMPGPKASPAAATWLG